MRPLVGAVTMIERPTGAGAHAVRMPATAPSSATRRRPWIIDGNKVIMPGTVPDTSARLEVHFSGPLKDCYGRCTDPLMLTLQLRTGSDDRLVEQLVTGVRQHIESRLLRPG